MNLRTVMRDARSKLISRWALAHGFPNKPDASAFRLLTLIPLLILLIPALASAAPHFRAAEGLFDLSNSKSLGLTTIVGEHKVIHHATEESG